MLIMGDIARLDVDEADSGRVTLEDPSDVSASITALTHGADSLMSVSSPKRAQRANSTYLLKDQLNIETTQKEDEMDARPTNNDPNLHLQPGAQARFVVPTLAHAVQRNGVQGQALQLGVGGPKSQA